MRSHRAVTVLARHPTRRALLATADGALPAAVLARGDREWTLPVVRRWLCESLGLDAALLEVLFEGDGRDEERPVATLAVTDVGQGDGAPPGSRDLRWRDVPDDAATSGLLAGLPANLRDRATTWLAEWFDGERVPVERARWARPGWFEGVAAWMTDTLEARDRPALGRVEQVDQSGISAILRAPTAAGDVWLKAVFPLFGAEPAVTQTLARFSPSSVPAVIATDEGEGVLLTEDLGTQTAATGGADAAIASIRTLTSLQRAAVAHAGTIRAAGAVARPLHELPDAFARAIAVPAAGDPISRGRSSALVSAVRDAVAVLEGLALPDTLVHGDFHNENVALVGGRPVIFDWSDVAIGNPLLDLVTWLGRVPEPDTRDAVWGAVRDGWAGVGNAGRIGEVRREVLVAGAAYQVVSYQAILLALEPALRYEYAPGFTGYLREIDAPRYRDG